MKNPQTKTSKIPVFTPSKSSTGRRAVRVSRRFALCGATREALAIAQPRGAQHS